jgi:N-acyl-D-aspartate/D-glutamate deacylase
VLDLIITGGLVVDGSGAPGRTADVVVDDGRIVAIGSVPDAAHRRIDADGLVVAPGFIDIHTHYDAQVHWDPVLSPSPHHGVTTVFGGNCGFTIAPLSGTEDDAAFVRSMLARVEGIPLATLEAAVPWDWSSFGQWLQRLDGRLAVNAGFLVGHSTVRRLVMGAEATTRAATVDERHRMVEVLDESLTAGGFGLSSSWIETHVDGAGDPVPSRAASLDELVELAGALARHPGTALEFVPGLGPFEGQQVEALVGMSRAAGRVLNWNILRAEHEQVEGKLDAFDLAAEHGAAVVALTPSEPTRLRVTLSNGMGFNTLPGWQDLFRLDVDERRHVLADVEVRRGLLDAIERAPVLKWPTSALVRWGELRVAETFDARLAELDGRLVGDIAREQGRDPFDVLCDIALADGLRTYFALPALGDDDATWTRRAGLWRDHRTLIGGADAGAHVDMMCGASYTTSLLGGGVRERRLLPLEAAVRALTGEPARLYGLHDRGGVAPGFRADLVVFDPERVASGPVRTVADLPGGASRLSSAPVGIHHVLVSGRSVIADGTATGDRPGSVLRPGRDSRTVTPEAFVAAVRGR